MNAIRRLTIAFLILVVSVQAAGASTITVNHDPGADGSSYVFKDFFFTDLAGTNFDGQTLSIDVRFGALLVAPLLSINLNLNQSSALGVWPTTGFTVSGYLLDDNGLPASAEKTMPLSLQMPGQLHSGWPYTLADGRHYVPATTGYELNYQGASTMAPGALIDPLVFSGVHFDITMPNTDDSLIGSRMSIASYGSGQFYRQPFDSPILVSPETIPTYTVPDAETTGLLLLGSLAAIIVTRIRLRAT